MSVDPVKGANISPVNHESRHLALHWPRGNTFYRDLVRDLCYKQNGFGLWYSWKEIHRLFCRFEQHICGGRYSESLLKLPTDITHCFE